MSELPKHPHEISSPLNHAESIANINIKSKVAIMVAEVLEYLGMRIVIERHSSKAGNKYAEI